MIRTFIHSIWLGDPPPPLIEECLASQQLPGYEHRLITLENCYRNTYVEECLAAKMWAKAADYLRIHYLNLWGGIYLDADVRVLRGFDDLLGEEMFVGAEENGFVSNAIIGSVAGHPILKDYLGKVERNFIGSGELVFQPGMFLWTEIVRYSAGVRIYPPDFFLPYNHHLNRLAVTRNTRTIHHFARSWKLPTVSIIIPQLGREEGLERCVRSIVASDYPQSLIDIRIIDGPATVPEKVKEGVARTKGEWVCYLANDAELTPSALRTAIECGREQGKGLVAFHEGPVYPDHGNICTHFILRRDLIERLGGEVFCTRMRHYGVDNLLWTKASRLDEATHCEKAVIWHHHCTTGAAFDEVYQKAASSVESDRLLLAEEMAKLG